MMRLFTLDGIQKKPAVFDTTKLEWMNGQYLSALPAAELLPPVRRELERMGVDAGGRDIVPLIDAVKTRSRTILHVAEQVVVRLDPDRAQLDPKGEALIRKLGPAFAANLRRAADTLDAVPPTAWSAEPILVALKAMAETHGLKLGDALQPVRVALTGSTVSEPVNELLAVVDRAVAIRRLRAVAAKWDGAGPAA
jgi:glutamyl-tRNA synthetase